MRAQGTAFDAVDIREGRGLLLLDFNALSGSLTVALPRRAVVDCRMPVNQTAGSASGITC